MMYILSRKHFFSFKIREQIKRRGERGDDIYMWRYMHIHTYIHTYIYTYVYTHTYVRTKLLQTWMKKVFWWEQNPEHLHRTWQIQEQTCKQMRRGSETEAWMFFLVKVKVKEKPTSLFLPESLLYSPWSLSLSLSLSKVLFNF
jgi:hypothetical protein